MTNNKRSTHTTRKLALLIKSRLKAALPLVRYRPGMSATLCLFFSLGFLIPACAQTAIGASEQVQEKAGIQEDTSEGILPVPDYSGDWKTRQFLTGDWGGKRQEWADKGLTFDVEWYDVGQGVVSGGRDERWAYVTNLDYYINIDPGDGASLEQESEAWAVYWNAWQYLFTTGEPPELIDPTDGHKKK